MKQKILDLLKEYTGKKYIKLTNTGNSAVFLSLLIAKKLGKEEILIPNQGGWLTFKTFPIDLKLKIMEIKTNYGILDLGDLNKKIDNKSALLITNMAGYFAQNPIKEIEKICKDKNCFFILDNSDSIKCKENPDIVFGSFGEWKPVNLHYGGFIGVDNKEYFEKIDREYFLMFKFNEKFNEKLYFKLTELDKRMKMFFDLNKKIKRDLKDFDIIHKDKKGINVVVKFKDEKEKDKLIKYCNKNNLEYTICPRYIRVNEKAVSIEVKRIN